MLASSLGDRSFPAFLNTFHYGHTLEMCRLLGILGFLYTPGAQSFQLLK